MLKVTLNNVMLIYFNFNVIHIYSGITSGRVLDGELLYTEILEVNLFAFAYRLFHEDFLDRNLHETVCIKSLVNGEKSSRHSL